MIAAGCSDARPVADPRPAEAASLQVYLTCYHRRDRLGWAMYIFLRLHHLRLPLCAIQGSEDGFTGSILALNGWVKD